MRARKLRGSISRGATPREVDALAAFVANAGSVAEAAAMLGISPSTLKRHLANLRMRLGLSTEQLIYAGRAAGWLVVPSLETTLTVSDTYDRPSQGSRLRVCQPPKFRPQARTGFLDLIQAVLDHFVASGFIQSSQERLRIDLVIHEVL